MTTTVTTTFNSTAKIFILFKDPAWDNLKPEKIHLFGRDYATDDSEALIDEVATDGLEVMRKKSIYNEEYPFSYWSYIPQVWFIDTYVTADLVSQAKDPRSPFRAWFEKIVTEWCITNGLSLKIERDKAREFYLKFSITVEPIAVASNSVTSNIVEV